MPCSGKCGESRYPEICLATEVLTHKFFHMFYSFAQRGSFLLILFLISGYSTD
jgi:hypothetical protein